MLLLITTLTLVTLLSNRELLILTDSPEQSSSSVVSSMSNDDERSLQEWEEIFHSRSLDDWRKLWHAEKHLRCQHELVAHMELVCQKDIYKLNRKKKKRDKSNNNRYLTFEQKFIDDDHHPGHQDDEHRFLSIQQANTFANRNLRRLLGDNDQVGSSPEQSTEWQHQPASGLMALRTRSKRGISDECCAGDGCSWEEYAEYCPANVRLRYK